MAGAAGALAKTDRAIPETEQITPIKDAFTAICSGVFDMKRAAHAGITVNADTSSNPVVLNDNATNTAIKMVNRRC